MIVPTVKRKSLDVDVLRLIPPDANVVVEVGCGSGELGARYKQRNPAGHYIGIEFEPSNAKQAEARLDRVLTCDPLQDADPGDTIEAASVDCLVYAGGLERFRDPRSALREHSRWLKDDGLVIASFLNVQHWRVLAGLLRGTWEHQTTGPAGPPLHRYFSVEGIRSLFDDAGLLVSEIQSAGERPPQSEKFVQSLAPALRELGVDPQAFGPLAEAHRFIIRAAKSEGLPRRVLVQTMLNAPLACDRVRILDPGEFNATIPGVRAVSTVKSADLNLGQPGEEKIFILQRTILRYPEHIAQQRSLLQKGFVIVAEIDDDPSRRKEYADNKYLSYRGCHAVQTSTEPLADCLREFNPNVAVFRNQLTRLPPPRTYTGAGKVTIFFGALNRENDWAPIMDSLNRVLKSRGKRVQVQVVHDRQFFDALRTNQKQFEPFCSYERYLELLSASDIGLLPLVPNRVNSMKSDLKLLEHAAHGVVALASPVVYEDSIVDGKTGFVYRSPTQFKSRLNQLITDESLRHRLAGAAYDWVKANRLLAQHYRERYQWYTQLLADRQHLTDQLRARVPEIFDGI